MFSRVGFICGNCHLHVLICQLENYPPPGLHLELTSAINPETPGGRSPGCSSAPVFAQLCTVGDSRFYFSTLELWEAAQSCSLARARAPRPVRGLKRRPMQDPDPGSARSHLTRTSPYSSAPNCPFSSSLQSVSRRIIEMA